MTYLKVARFSRSSQCPGKGAGTAKITIDATKIIPHHGLEPPLTGRLAAATPAAAAVPWGLLIRGTPIRSYLP